MKTKKQISVLLLATSLATSSIFAETFNIVESGGISNWSANWSSTSTWQGGLVPTAGSDIISGADSTPASANVTRTITFDASVPYNTIASYRAGAIGSTAVRYVENLVLAQNLTITGDLVRGRTTGTQAFTVSGDYDLVVGGTLRNLFGGGCAIVITTKTATIASIDNAKSNINAHISLAVKNGTVVSGLVNFSYVGAIGSFILNSSSGTSKLAATSVRIGAITCSSGASGTGSTGFSIIAAGATSSNGNAAHLTITGTSPTDTQTYTYYGTVANYGGTATSGSLSVIMSSQDKGFTQEFAGASTYTGDTILTKGNLKFSGSTNLGKIFLGYDTTRNATTDVVEGKTAKSGAETALIIEKGFTASDLSWSSGSIVMDLSGMTVSDNMMNLTSLSLTGSSYLFDFLGTAQIDNTYTLVTLSDAISDKDVSNFSADTSGIFQWDESGKVLTFTANVPEPAEIASLLGLLTLGFIIYRRKYSR